MDKDRQIATLLSQQAAIYVMLDTMTRLGGNSVGGFVEVREPDFIRLTRELMEVGSQIGFVARQMLGEEEQHE